MGDCVPDFHCVLYLVMSACSLEGQGHCLWLLVGQEDVQINGSSLARCLLTLGVLDLAREDEEEKKGINEEWRGKKRGQKKKQKGE